MIEVEASGRGHPLGDTHPLGDAHPPYMIFVVVFLFFITGLFGFLICHLLKKKGYRCRTGQMDEDEEEEEKLGDDTDEQNQDTVEQILKCIIENEANMEAFNEMLGNRNICVRHDPRLRKESIGGLPPHVHTVHSGTDLNTCHLCAQMKSKKDRRPSRTPRFKQRPGEQTVFSVGRFRVTHTDKKPHGGPTPLMSSGDQLDEESEERKESGHNLRNLFKDVRPPSETSNWVAPNVGKRRRSLTLFGLRRGSDPVGVKGVVEGVGRDTGVGKYAIQQQPVVLEEPLKESVEGGPKPETGAVTHASPENETVLLGSINADQQADAIHTVVPEGSTYGSSLEPCTDCTAIAIGTGPASLPLSDVTDRKYIDRKSFKNEDDPGPLQTSTPMSPPMAGSITGLTPMAFTLQGDQDSRNVLPVKQIPPDPCSSPDLESNSGASPVLISLGSSPPSFSNKNMSSSSPLKTPTSPVAVSPRPKLSSKGTAIECKTPVRTPSLKLSAVQEMGSKPSSPSLGRGTSPSLSQPPPPALNASPKLEIIQVSSQNPSFLQPNPDPSFERSPHSSLMTDATFSNATSQKESDQSDRSSKDSLPLLPSSPLSSLTPVTSRVSHVTIVKAGPYGKRQFSVVTMVEETEQEASGKSPEGQTLQPEDSTAQTVQPENPTGQTVQPENPTGQTIKPENPTGQTVQPENSTGQTVQPENSTGQTVQPENPTGQTVQPENPTGQTVQPENPTGQTVQPENPTGQTVQPENPTGQTVQPENPTGQTVQPENPTGQTCRAETTPSVTQDKDNMVEMEDIKDCKVTEVEETD